jgi:Protein of unknown function (DUF3396)
MNSLLDENELDLTKLLCIRDADGRPALRIGLVATVFFEQPWTRPVREAVTDLAESYIEEFREHLRWAQHPRTAYIHPIHSKRVRRPREWLPEHEDGSAWEFGFHGGEGNEIVSDFQVSAYGPGDVRKDKLGYFQVYLPLFWFAEHPGTFPEYVTKICQRIKPVSGYGGVGILHPLDIRAGNRVASMVRPLAERFPGLEINAPIEEALSVTEGIKGVNWLTILGERWIEAAGGHDYLRARLDDNFSFHRYDGGLMIQAGPKPQIGDAEANRWPKHYVTLAKVLKKIQVTEHWAFHWGGPGTMDHDATLAWIFRFDGK